MYGIHAFHCIFFQRWQRRFFVLYDDGELAYSVDENVSHNNLGPVVQNKRHR